MASPLVITAGLTEDIVLQRDADDQATVHAQGKSPNGADTVLATVRRWEVPLPDWEAREVGRAENGKWTATLPGLPTGGPYAIELSLASQPESAVSVRGVLVGDLWVLAGQSNMEGCGELHDMEPPSPYVHVFDMADHWHIAEEPLHWLCDSPDSCHSEATGKEQRKLMKEARRTRTQGAGLGLPFANALVRANGVPIGLIACAHGGTSMQQWEPALKGQGGAALYGSMLRRVRLVGGKVRGVLWYQGESDANPADVALFPERFKHLIANVRADFGDPNLPFYYVQIGRVIPPPDWGANDPTPWNAIQEHQRRLAEEIPNTAVVASIDLALDDLIHIGTTGLKWLGQRLARVAERAQQDEAGLPFGPRLRAVTVEGNNRDLLRVSFDGLPPAGFPPLVRITGFSLHESSGAERPWIFKAAVDPKHPTDILLRLIGPLPDGLSLWYGRGFDPPCTLTDADNMAVPVFGPIPL